MTERAVEGYIANNSSLHCVCTNHAVQLWSCEDTGHGVKTDFCFSIVDRYGQDTGNCGVKTWAVVELRIRGLCLHRTFVRAFLILN